MFVVLCACAAGLWGGTALWGWPNGCSGNRCRPGFDPRALGLAASEAKAATGDGGTLGEVFLDPGDAFGLGGELHGAAAPGGYV